MNYLLYSLIILNINFILFAIKPISDIITMENIDYKKDWKRILITNFIFLVYSLSLYFILPKELKLYVIPIIILTKYFNYITLIPVFIISTTIFMQTNNLILSFVPLLIFLITSFYFFDNIKKIKKEIMKDGIITLLLSIALLSYRIKELNLISFNVQFKDMTSFYLEITLIALTLLSLYFVKAIINKWKGVKKELAQTKHQNKSFSSLKKSNQKILSNFNLDETYYQLVKMGIDELNADKGGILNYKSDNDNLVLKEGINIEHLKINNKEGYIGDYFKRRNKIEIKNKFEIEKLKNNGANISKVLTKNFGSLIIAPIYINDNKQSLIFFISKKENHFENWNKTFIRELVNYAPFMIKKAEMLEERNQTLEELNQTLEKLDKNNKNLSSLNKASNLLNQTLDINETIDIATDVILNTLNCSESTLFLLNRETGELELKRCNSFDKDCNSKLVSHLSNLAQKTIQQEEITIKRVYPNNSQMKAVITIPLILQNNILGVIQAIQSNMFENLDREFLSTLSNQVSVAIDNSRMYNKMRRTAIRDSLTGLYNHSYFKDQLSQEINRVKRENTSLSLLILDIDDFKHFNDTYGHQAGDEVLKELADVLQTNSREYDTVARYGGEEFVLILPNTSQEEVVKVGKRYNKIIRDMKIEYQDEELSVTASIGVTTYQEGLNQKVFIERADKGLYQAKEEGKDTTCYFA